MKKRVVALLLGLAAISLAACGGKKAESQAETTKAAESGTDKAGEKESAKATEQAKADGEDEKIKIGATPSPHA